MKMRQFPVKSSPPAMITIISPIGKTSPLKNLPSATGTTPHDTIWLVSPPNAMKIPANTARTNMTQDFRVVFPSPTMMYKLAISAGVFIRFLLACLVRFSRMEKQVIMTIPFNGRIVHGKNSRLCAGGKELKNSVIVQSSVVQVVTRQG